MAKKPPGIPGRCIFCDGTGLTREHIYAKWLQPYLPKTGQLNHESFSELGLLSHSEVRIKKRSGEPHSGRLKVVCKTCNTGWMSRLQETAKPILLPLVTGATTTLFRRHQEILSAWIAMFTMVNEHYERNEMFVATSQTERRYLKDNRIPPSNWKIWVGHYTRHKWIGLWVHTTAPISGLEHVPEETHGGMRLPNTQSTTFLVGKLLVHVFSSANTGIVRRQDFRYAGLPRIWPIKTSPRKWPPPILLDDTDADEIATAFKKRLKAIHLNRLAGQGGAP